MQLPVIRGIIDRRILANYRVDPTVAARLLPPPFQPKCAGGFAIAGICLIRLKQIRPAFLPAAFGIGSENAAHRFAVQWEHDGQLREGVYIPRRDTSSRMNALAGGRLFPGEHHHAKFEVEETEHRLSVQFKSDDGEAAVSVSGRVTDTLPRSSVFESLQVASRFFEGGSLGYSATRDASRLDGVELRCSQWHVAPLEIESVQSSYFDDPAVFPPGSATFDCALLMRNIEHEWHAQQPLCCSSNGHAPSPAIQ